MSKPPVEVPQGAIRFNTDSQKMEFFAQDQWWEMETDVPYLGKATNSDIPGGPRGLIGGGADPGFSTMVQAFDLTSSGSCFNFGSLSSGRYYIGGFASRTRAVWGGGSESGGYVDTIEYHTIPTGGSAVAFGELVGTDRHGLSGLANQTRGLYLGGENPSKIAEIDYVTIASTGDAKDFGDLSAARATTAAMASPTRGVSVGGIEGSAVNTIEFVTIATTGTRSDFGDQWKTVYGGGGGGNATRGVVMGGYKHPANVKTIEYITIATTGNSAEFGEMAIERRYGATCSSSIRAVHCGGLNPAVEDTMDCITIATQGDSVDFGNLHDHMYAISHCGTSNAHGGL